MRVDHRKISVAATTEPRSAGPMGGGTGGVGAAGAPRASASVPADVAPPSAASASPMGASAATPPTPTLIRERLVASGSEFRDLVREVDSTLADVVADDFTRRRLYFEDIETRRSRLRGVSCRVTLRKGESSYTGEAEGLEGERARVDLAARAALKAIGHAEGGERSLALDGIKLIDAFDREFVFVGVAAQIGRDRALLTGSCEVKESPEQASVLATLDATNRWIAHGR
jgi:hypothetical protein